MQLKDIMTTQVRVISADATVQDAAKKLDDENVGALPVCDGDRMIGIVTDRDIVIRSTSAGQEPGKISVRDVMTSPVTYGFVDQSIEEAAAILKQNYIRRLPVLDRDQRLVGMVTADDLMIDAPERAGLAAEVFQKVSEVERPGL
ncbi:MAG TPA: CBS domain-containing protein [Kofleriaceae bacterium]